MKVPSSSSSASSAEVVNAQSSSFLHYPKRLLVIVTADCSSAITEAAEIQRSLKGRSESTGALED